MAHTFITCSNCGKEEDMESFRSLNNPLVTKMRNEQLCFDCAYWMDKLLKPNPDTAIISGGLYKINGPFTRVPFRRTRAIDLQFVIEVNSTNVYATKDITLIGEIPIRLSQMVPDQYRFITREEYRRIIRFESDMCLSKGCFDRYHCLWYRADIAEPEEPWNKIPKDYQIGGECCPSFIDKYGININD